MESISINEFTKYLDIIEKFEPKPESNFSRSHIFTSILKYVQEGTTKEQTLDMLNHFFWYEKCLNFSRTNNPKLADYWFNKVQNNPLQLNGLAINGMNALYFPMESYMQYKKKEFHKAIELLDVAIENILILQENGLIEAILAEKEQLLNKFKVSIANKDLNLIKNSLESFFKNLIIDLKKVSKNNEEWIDLIEYYIDAVIFELYKLKENNIELLIFTLAKIQNQLPKEFEFYTLYSENFDKILEGIEPLFVCNFEYINKGNAFSNLLPNSFNYILFNIYSQFFTENKIDNADYKKLKNQFLNKKIEVPHFLTN